MKEHVEFLLGFAEPTKEEQDAVQEYVTSNMDIKDYDNLVEDLYQVESGSIQDPYYEQMVLETLKENIQIIESVSDYIDRVLLDEDVQELFFINFKQ